MLLLHVVVLALSAALWTLALPGTLHRGLVIALAVLLPPALMLGLYAPLIATGRVRVEPAFRLGAPRLQGAVLAACAGAPLLWMLFAA